MGQVKKEALAEFNRTRILETAKQLFSEKGVGPTTMDDIAKKADYSKSTLYVYFKNKEDIYNSIVYENMLLLKQGVLECIRSSDYFDNRYYAICRTLTDFQARYPLYFESILGEINVQPEDLEQQMILREIYKTGEELNALLGKFLRDGIAEGRVRPDLQLLPATFTLWAGICGLITLADKKSIYFQMKLKNGKQSFLNYGFALLLRTILKEPQEEEIYEAD